MNKTSDTLGLVCAVYWTVSIQRQTVNSVNCSAANCNTMTVKFSSTSLMRHTKCATPHYSWPNCTFNCKMYVNENYWIIDHVWLFDNINCWKYLYWQDGSRLTNIAHSIHHAINLLMPKLSPENIKCVCQTLKVTRKHYYMNIWIYRFDCFICFWNE